MAEQNQHPMLVDLQEMSRMVIKFIGTERFDEIVSSLQDDAQSGFAAGLSFAICLAMAECNVYTYHKKDGDDKQ